MIYELMTDVYCILTTCEHMRLIKQTFCGNLIVSHNQVIQQTQLSVLVSTKLYGTFWHTLKYVHPYIDIKYIYI